MRSSTPHYIGCKVMQIVRIGRRTPNLCQTQFAIRFRGDGLIAPKPINFQFIKFKAKITSLRLSFQIPHIFSPIAECRTADMS